MFDKKEQQTIQGVNDSQINQAGGNVIVNNYGMSVTEVMGLVKELVSSEMSQYLHQAQITAQDRLKDFSSKFEERIDAKLHEHLCRFNEPSIQLAAREAALGYIRNGNAVEGDALVDLLIERVLVEEHSTKQKLIDQAIKILPTLSHECLALITFIAFVNIQKFCSRHEYQKWIECINPVIDALVKVQPLDIAFLHQAECATGVPGITYTKNYIETQLQHEDLFFRHPASEQFTSYLKNKYGMKFFEHGFTVSRSLGQQFLVDFINVFIPNDSQCFNCMRTSYDSLKQALVENKFDDLAKDLDKFMEESIPYTKDEVKDFLISINENWNTALGLFSRGDFQSMRLTPVGNYIACRQLTKLSGKKLDMSIFYN